MSDATREYAGELGERRKRRPSAYPLVRFIKDKPLGTVGGVIVMVMILTGVFANVLAPYGMNESHIAYRLSPPSGQFLMGTDVLGRDLLSRIIFGARISMVVGIGGALIGILVAAVIGLASGFLGGKVDITVQRLVDAVMCFPWLFIMLTVMVLIGAGLVKVMITLGVIYGIYSSRVVRSAVIGIVGNTYVEAGRALGCSTGRMLVRHILPNVTAPIIIVFTSSVGSIILSEATLSFLGYGVPPPQPSWGGLLSREGRQYMMIAPWLAIWPGVVLSLVVFGVNVLGDAIRDVLDPRLKGGLGRYNRFRGLGKT